MVSAGRVALTGASDHFDHYSVETDKYFSVAAYSPKRGQFAVVFQDITSAKRAEAALAEARARLKEGQDNPEVYRTASGQTFRNVAKYDEKVNALQEEVSSHEKNVEALKREIANLK